MPTNFPKVFDATLQKFLDGMLTTIVRPDGTHPDAAPNAWKDRLQKTIILDGTEKEPASEFVFVLHVSPDGVTATAKMTPVAPKAGCEVIFGEVDITRLAALLV